jgi:Mg-chelatase subunit ChlD
MNTQIVPGSLSAIAQRDNVGLAESFLNCDVLILLDMSGSMDTHDAPGNRTRADVAREDVIRLQATHKGKIALFCFADYCIFAPGGMPLSCGGSTNMAAALHYVQPADDCGSKIILVSDGMPNDATKTLEIAREFKNRIDTIFCGPENDVDGGRAFLEKLARATGGQAVTSAAPGALGEEMLLLIDKSG